MEYVSFEIFFYSLNIYNFFSKNYIFQDASTPVELRGLSRKEYMNMFIRTNIRSQPVVGVTVLPSDTLMDLKLKVERQTGFPVENQKYEINGQPLCFNGGTLRGYNIKEYTPLRLKMVVR